MSQQSPQNAPRPNVTAKPIRGSSFLHIEGLSPEEKKRWVDAANKSKQTLPDWVTAKLNAAAEEEARRNATEK